MYIENTTVRKCCPVCGKKFKPIQGTQKFCSHECYTIYAKAQREENKIKRKLEKEKKQHQKNLKYTIEDICYIEGVFNRFIKENKLPLSYQHYADIMEGDYMIIKNKVFYDKFVTGIVEYDGILYFATTEGVLEYNSDTKELKYKKGLITLS